MPEALRLADGYREKQVLVDAFAGRVPKSIAARGKQPYRAPAKSCFGSARTAERINEQLARTLPSIGFLNVDRVRKFVQRAVRPEGGMSQRDEVAFVSLLSMLELFSAFISDFRHPTFPDRLLTTVHDERRDAKRP
jgi:hypothetical protein